MPTPCPRCQRHVLTGTCCPFCGSLGLRLAAPTGVVAAIAIAGAAVLLAACYGPPPSDGIPYDDEDADARVEHVFDGGETGGDADASGDSTSDNEEATVEASAD